MSLVIDNVRIRVPEPTDARALLIDGGRIVALVGDGRDAPGAARLDGGGAVVVPGFVDAHGHLLAFAASPLAVDCRGAPDIATIRALIAGRAARTPPGDWVRAYGYDERDLAERRHPTRRDLDAAAPHHPVRLGHRGGHALVLNSAALALCGITTTTEEPPGGYIERELPGGEPSGILFEMGDLVDGRLPPPDDGELERAVIEAERRLLGAGVTAFHDAGADNGPDDWRTLGRLVASGRFRPRLLAMTGWDAFVRGDEIAAVAPAIAGTHVKVSLSELGGEIVPSPAELAARVRRIHEAGRNVAVHAVTEAGVKAAADAIAATIEGLSQPHRHRIEHASICPPGLTERLSALGITIVSQPTFLAVNGDRYLSAIDPADLPHLYPFGGWERSGVRLGFGSDCPVADPDPLLAIRAAVERTTAGGAALPGRGMTPKAALRAATAGAAAAAGLDDELGALRPGLRADLVILSAEQANREGEPVVLEATFVKGRPLVASAAYAERLSAAGISVDTVYVT